MPRKKQCSRCILALMILAFASVWAMDARAQTVIAIEKDSFIRATVPAAATTGTLLIVTPSGTLNSNPQFVVTK